MAQHTAQALRRRAWHLRCLATEIERSPVLTLDRYAGGAAWVGGRPDACVRLLRSHQTRLLQDADDLRWEAYLLDQRADELDQLAALQPGTVR